MTNGLSLGTCALGRAIDAFGRPLDGGPALRGRRTEVAPRPPAPGERVPVDRPLWTGIRVLDALLTIGRGARIGIFGAPGAGKSTLVESVVAGCEADAVVVALVGERGREAQRWIERCDERTTIVCATSDRSAQERILAAQVALAHAGALRERGLHVLFVLDSLARVATALRERGVAAGESTGRGGYPPNVFAELAKLVEVAGPLLCGSITLVATVVHDGDERDPVSEAARSMLDGHIALSQKLAEAGRFPAIDVLGSASRTMESIAESAHLNAARTLRRALAVLNRIEDARALGITPAESAARAAIAVEDRLESFLRQDRRPTDHRSTLAVLLEIAEFLSDGDGNRPR